MITATESPKARKHESQKPLAAHLLRALHAEWRKLSPGLAIEPSGDLAIERLEEQSPDRQIAKSQNAERQARLAWSSQVLKKVVASWKELSQGEAKRLLRQMRAELGETPLNDYIARAALRLWGGDWNEALAERIAQRFKRGPEIAALKFWMKRSLFEELCRRVSEAEGKDVETVRMEIVRSKA